MRYIIIDIIIIIISIRLGDCCDNDFGLSGRNRPYVNGCFH